MTDREKVIRAMECCAVGAECDHCPYSSMNQSGHEGCYQMHADALALLKAQEPRVMTADEAMAAISGNQPIVIETRKYGIVADWYSARNKNEFSEWMRQRTLAGAYPRIEYNRTWRGWFWEPEKKQREATPWQTPSINASAPNG